MANQKYKLVPVEPTAEMVEAAEDAYMPFGDMELAIRMAVLAAPDVQGEPDTHSFLEYPSFEESANFDPVPAVQGEPVAFCGDAALSLAERTFSTEVDEQLASDITQYARRLHTLYAAPQPAPNTPTFQLGDHVRKTKGSQWKGRVVGTYSTSLTPEGYAVESDTEKGSVQIYPVGALELVGGDA